jgi:hypothetical protein
MSNHTDWEVKYKALLSKYMNGVDLAFQKGYQKGLDDAEKEQMAQQQQAEAETAAAVQTGALPGQDDPNGGDPYAVNENAAMADEANGQAEGSELDQSLQEMEALVAKSKGKLGDELKKTIAKVINDADALNKSLQNKAKLDETKNAVKITTGKPAPKVLTEQHKVIKSMIANWDIDSSDTSSKIEKAIKNAKK